MDYLSLIDEITLKEEFDMGDNYLVLVDEMSLEEEYKELLHISKDQYLTEGVLSVIASLLSYIKEKILGFLRKLIGLFKNKSESNDSNKSVTKNSNSSNNSTKNSNSSNNFNYSREDEDYKRIGTSKRNSNSNYSREDEDYKRIGTSKRNSSSSNKSNYSREDEDYKRIGTSKRNSSSSNKSNYSREDEDYKRIGVNKTKTNTNTNNEYKNKNTKVYKLYSEKNFKDIINQFRTCNYYLNEVWNKSKKDSDEVQNLVKDLSANLNSSSDSYFANHKNNNTTSENFGEHLKLEIRDYNKIINRIGKVESYEPTEQELTKSELIDYSSRVFKIFDIKFTSREAYNLSLGADPAEVLKIRSKNEYNKIVKEMQTYYKSTESNVKVIESISNKNPDNSNLKYIKEVCSIMIDLGKVYINISTTFLKLNLKASTMFRAIPALTI